MTTAELVFFLAGITVGFDIALLIHFWPTIRTDRRSAKTRAAEQ